MNSRREISRCISVDRFIYPSFITLLSKQCQHFSLRDLLTDVADVAHYDGPAINVIK